MSQVALIGPQDPVPRLTQDFEAEAAVLGTVLVDSTRFALAQTRLQEDDFYQDLHQRVWRSMVRLARRGEPIDLLTVTKDLEAAGETGDSSVDNARVAKLMDGRFKSANIAHYCETVAECARRRRIMTAAQALMSVAGDTGTDGEVDEQLRRLVKAADRKAAPLPADDAADVLGRPCPNTPVAVDGLLAEGDVALLSGPGGIGKSWLVLHLGLTLASGGPIWAGSG